jgi:hypothetical protein
MPRAHFALGFIDRSHIALEAPTLDRDPRGNTFINPSKRAMEFALVSGGEISGNTFRRGGPEPIRLIDCTIVIMRE